MKRLGKMLFCVVLAALFCAPSAIAAGDSEEELRAALDSASGGGACAEFYYDDYDGDGNCEAFALIGRGDDFGYQGDLWFVSAAGAQLLMSDAAYDYFDLRGAPPTKMFLAEEGFGGSWSESHMWFVFEGQPIAMDYDPNGCESDTEFYEYIDAFDACVDGTGHTWKRYYFYLENGVKREYGGIGIGESELYEFAGARELVQPMLDQGFWITGIVYRANRVINVNFCNGFDNSNLSLRYDESSVTYWEEDEGVYKFASDPFIATYPDEFVHPVGGALPTSAPTQAPALPTSAPMPTEGGGTDLPAETGSASCSYDIDGNGSPELLTLYRAMGKDSRGFDAIDVYLEVANGDGATLGRGRVYSHYYSDNLPGKPMELRLYALAANRLYVEGTSSSGDSSDTYYGLVELADGTPVSRVNLRDPGYSDGYGLEDPFTNDYVFDCRDNSAGKQVLVAPLNDAFAPYGVRFEVREKRVAATVGQEWMILSANVWDLPALDQSPTNGTTGETSVVQENPASSAHTTGDVYLRDQPNKNANSLCVVPNGTTLAYLGQSSVDERGVAWYYVRYGEIVGWGSSKFVALD